MNKDDLINFYKGTNYSSTSLSVRNIPPRPSEWNMPLFIKNVYPNNKNLFESSFAEGRIEIELDQKDLDYFKALILHESLFNFHKAYYNYLCALKMHDGGLEHWIRVTSYYSKLYLADSVLALSGQTRYVVNGSSNYFVEDIYKLINLNKYQKNIEQNGEFIPKYAQYVIDVNIMPDRSSGKILIHKNKGSGGSHTYIWNKYSNLNTSKFGITKLTYDYPKHLSDERNLENYTFEGYRQLDFNLPIDNFKSYFERDYIKNQTDLIYTSETAIVLGVIGQLYNVFKVLDVKGLPIEEEKLIYMCKYSLGDSEQSIKLIDLISLGFPEKNKYLEEYHRFESM